MPVFKAYLRIIRQNAAQLLMYIGIVTGLAIMMTMFNAQSAQTGFSSSKVQTAVIVADSEVDSEWIAGLLTFLEQTSDLVSLPDDSQLIRDALFFGEISYVLRVPSNFSEQFRTGETEVGTLLERLAAPDSTNAIYMDMLVNNYLQTVRLYRAGLPHVSDQEIARYALANLNLSTPVELASQKSWRGSYENIIYFYNYLAYALLAILILGISTCMMTFNNLDLKRRNLCSPVSLRSQNLQLLIGNLTFAGASWLVMIGVSFLLYRGAMLTWTGFFLALNAFVFMLVGLCLSYLIGHALKSRNAQAAVANVLTLGTSFIAGVFVPQVFLGDTVLGIARFTPTFWFVRANITIGSLDRFEWDRLGEIRQAILIQLGFAVVFLMVAMILVYQRRQANQ